MNRLINKIKQKMKKLLFLFFILILTTGCPIVNEVMIHFPLTIYTQGALIGQNENDLLPGSITKLLQPIKFGDSIYIADIQVIRLDLPKEKPYFLEVPVSIENSIKIKLKTYDFSCLKDDYDQNIPTMTLGKYFVQPGDKEGKVLNPKISSDALVFTISLQEYDAIDTTIEHYASILRKGGVSKIIIYLETKVEDDSDQTISVLFNEAEKFFNNKDYEKATKKYKEILTIDPQNSSVTKRLTEIGQSTTIKETKITSGSLKTEQDSKTQAPPTKCGNTLDLGYATYYGPTIMFEGRCVMHGFNGTLKFKTQHEIPLINQSKIKIANPGDYVTGRWENGLLMNGHRFDSKDNTTEAIYGT